METAYNFEPIPKELHSKYHHKIIGTGCQMWGEWIPSRGEMHFQTFPRIAAFAEVGWTRKENKNYAAFEKRLEPLYSRWKSNGLYPAPLKAAVQAKK